MKAHDFFGLIGENSTILSILLDSDSDGDQLFDHQEMNVYFTDFQKNDTDGDLLDDGSEILVYNTNPLENDTDSDLLDDYSEIFTYQTDPTQNDTDTDGFTDGFEIFTLNTDPTSNDSDSDGCDDFSEVKFFYTDPNVVDNHRNDWDGGLIEIKPEFRPNEPHFLPFSQSSLKSEKNFLIPRLLFLYITERIRHDWAVSTNNTNNETNSETNAEVFYISRLQRVSSLKILVIDNFNSTDFTERVHGNTCADILSETLESVFGPEEAGRDFSILKYSVAEGDRNWGTALDYAVEQGVDVISISQVSAYGSYPYFDEISRVVEKYQVIFVAGSGNDNKGDPVLNATYNLRYPATHPETIVVGGVVLNSGVNPSQWERWDEGAGMPGSNWGRGKIKYNGTDYFSAVELVADCYRRIAFSDYFGVSWAIPKVAGYAAAVMQANPLLTQLDVRIILQTTAARITPSLYSYDDGPFSGWVSGWNPEVGYGMVDVSQALNEAQQWYVF